MGPLRSPKLVLTALLFLNGFGNKYDVQYATAHTGAMLESFKKRKQESPAGLMIRSVGKSSALIFCSGVASRALYYNAGSIPASWPRFGILRLLTTTGEKMSKQMKPEIMIRIRAADPESPIAIFTCPEPMHYSASFYNTVAVISAIKHNNPNFIGAFHKDTKGDAMRAML